MLLEKDDLGRDCLELLSKFQLYRIIQHRNVNEILMQIYKSKYAIELNFISSYIAAKIMYSEKACSTEDIERKYRTGKFTVDRANHK
mmetsp:Transcript_44554/g.43212  ORF Transcript_44554/g.43212 Transcript_44554/m.43212 type:complete len:87 (-) Transcript_44554:9-269(-)